MKTTRRYISEGVNVNKCPVLEQFKHNFIHSASSEEQNQLCVSKKADIIVSIPIKVNFLLIALRALWCHCLFCAYAGLIFVCDPSYELWAVVMKLNAIHCYSCVEESTAARPVTETDNTSTAQILIITSRHVCYLVEQIFVEVQRYVTCLRKPKTTKKGQVCYKEQGVFGENKYSIDKMCLRKIDLS
jgi:hypothetical protein